MALLLGDLADAVHGGERLHEIGELDRLGDVVIPLGRPAVHLPEQSRDFVARQRRDAAFAGYAVLSSQFGCVHFGLHFLCIRWPIGADAAVSRGARESQLSPISTVGYPYQSSVRASNGTPLILGVQRLRVLAGHSAAPPRESVNIPAGCY